MPKYHFFKWPFRRKEEPPTETAMTSSTADVTVTYGGLETYTEEPAMHSIELYLDKRGEYRFRCKARNGAIVAVSSEGYKDKRDAEHAIRLVRSSGIAAIKDLTEGGE